MMIWISDRTRRFRKRPYFFEDGLNRRCERGIQQFTEKLYGQFTVPVPTGALIKLLEKHAAHLNLYADLSADGEGVEGVTSFFSGQKPDAHIARQLYMDHIRAHRLR